MAGSAICTRAVLSATDTLTRAASSFSSPSSAASFETVKVVAARKRLCAVPDGFGSLGRSQLRPIEFGNVGGSSQVPRTTVEKEWDQISGVLVRVEKGDRGGDSNRDDDGVIKDMELYLDDLSLEYDSVWDTKPAWCQPWTIVTTGLAVIGASWFSFQNIFVTGGACFGIGVWWFSFLYAYPLAYTEMIAERQKKAKSGYEDTFGTRRVQ